ACAVTAGLRRPVSVTETPRRRRPTLLRAAMWPSMVHGSMLAFNFGRTFVAPQYFCFHNDRGNNWLRWSGTQNESTRLATAPRYWARVSVSGVGRAATVGSITPT